MEDIGYLDTKPTEKLLYYQEDLKFKISKLQKTLKQKKNKLNYIEALLKGRSVRTHYHNKNNPKRNDY